MVQDIAAWETPDAEYAHFIQGKTVIQDLLKGSVEEMRDRYTKMKAAAGTPAIDTLGLDIKDVSVPTAGGSFPVRIYRPPGNDRLPVLVVIHGGGWALGDLSNEHANCILWAKNFRAVVVNVDYRLAPEHPYPIPADDAWTAFQWTIQNADQYSIDASKILLYGNSAGANLASTVAQRARDQGIKLTGQLLRIPALAHYEAAPDASFAKYEDADILNSDSMRTFWAAYLSKGGDPKDKRISPLLGDVKGLPPTFLQVAGADPLRDSALAYSEKLKAAGVETELKVYPGVPHGFNLLPIKLAKECTDDLLAAGKRILTAAGHKLE